MTVYPKPCVRPKIQLLTMENKNNAVAATFAVSGASIPVINCEKSVLWVALGS